MGEKGHIILQLWSQHERLSFDAHLLPFLLSGKTGANRFDDEVKRGKSKIALFQLAHPPKLGAI